MTLMRNNKFFRRKLRHCIICTQIIFVGNKIVWNSRRYFIILTYNLNNDSVKSEIETMIFNMVSIKFSDPETQTASGDY